MMHFFVSLTFFHQFKKISEAYQVLSDPTLRKRYNEFGEENGVRPDGGFGKYFQPYKKYIAV